MPPVAKGKPPVGFANHEIVPTAIAFKVTEPEPQIALLATLLIVGILFTVAAIIVLAEVHPFAVTSA